MSQLVGVKQELTGPSDNSDDTNILEIEDEKSGESDADEEMMQWALRTLQRTQYLSDSENEDDEKKEKSPVRVHSPRAKRTSKSRVSWKNVSTVLSQLANPGTQKVNSSSTDVKLKKDVRIVVQRIEESTDPEVLAYFTRLKSSTRGNAASPPVDPLAVTIKEEPPPSPSAAAQNTEDPTEDSAFNLVNGCDSDAVLIKSEWLTTLPPYAVVDDFFEAVFEERVEDPLDGVASCQTENIALPALAECIIQNNQITKESTTAKTESDCTEDKEVHYDRDLQEKECTLRSKEPMEMTVDVDCTVEYKDPWPSGHMPLSKVCDTLKTPLPGDNGEDLRKKCETSRTKELPCSGDEMSQVWDKFVASVPPPRSPTTWKVRASTPEEKTLFRMQERARFKNQRRAFTYRLHGYESVVGPLRRSCVATGGPGICVMNITDKSILLSLTLVCDAVARLPNGMGSLDNVMELLSDSQFVKISRPWEASVISRVIGDLAILNLEDKPCLRYDAKHNICVYLHRAKSEKELESLYSRQRNASRASMARGPLKVRDIQELRMPERPVTVVGPPACSDQRKPQPALPTGGKRVYFSSSGYMTTSHGAQVVCIDPNNTEQRLCPGKLRVIAEGDGSGVVKPATFGKKSSATASASGVSTIVSSSPTTTLTNRISSSSLANCELVSYPPSGKRCLTNKTITAVGMLKSSPPAVLTTPVANQLISLPSSSSSSLTNGAVSLSSPSTFRKGLSSSSFLNGVIPSPLGSASSSNLLSKVLPSPVSSSSSSVNGVLQSSPLSSSSPLMNELLSSSSSSVAESATRVQEQQKTESKIVEQALPNDVLSQKDSSVSVLKEVVQSSGVRKYFNRRSSRNPLTDLVAVHETSPQVPNMTAENPCICSYADRKGGSTICPTCGLFPSSQPGAPASSTAARSTSHDAATKDLNNGSYRNPLTDLAAANKTSPQVPNMTAENPCICSYADRSGGSILCPICGFFPSTKPGAPASSTAARSTSHDAATKDLNNGSCRNPLTDFAAGSKPSSGLTNIAVEKTCKCAHADGTGGCIKCLICGLFRRALPGAAASGTAGKSTYLYAARRDFNRESCSNPFRDFAAVPDTSSQVKSVATQHTSVICRLPPVDHENGVAPSDARVPNSAVNVATECGMTMERAASGDSTLHNMAKGNAAEDNTRTSNRMMSKTAMCAAVGESVTPVPSQPLSREGICVKCYEHFVSFEAYFKNRKILEGGRFEGRPGDACFDATKELSGKEPCSLCDSSGGVGWAILVYIVSQWIHECKFCKRRYIDRGVLSYHENFCTLRSHISGPNHCLICGGKYGVVNTFLRPLLFNLHMNCVLCGQLFISFFNLGLYWMNNQLQRINIHITGLACVVCGLQLKGKKSLNAHMKEHEVPSLLAVEGRTPPSHRSRLY